MKRSASLHRIGVGPAEPMHAATPRRSGQIDSASEQTAITIALRVPILANCCGPSAGAMWKAAISSSSARQFRFGPVTNSPTGIRRVPAARRELDLGIGREQRRQPVPGGRRGAEVAPDRPAVADLGRSHRARRDGQPGQAVAELGDQPRVRDAGPDAQVTVLGPPFGQLGNPREVEDHPRADAVEVELDHQVRAAGDRNRVRMRGLELERLVPAVGLEHLHAR